MPRKSAQTPASTSQQQLNFADDAGPPVEAGPTVWSVSAITQYLGNVWSADPLLGQAVVVQGELTNVKRSSRGHIYFTLKDESAAINGILWASQALRLKFDLEDGLEVFLTGNLEIYARSGTYSIVAKKLEPVGVGALQLAFQKIKEKLEAEGLFKEAYKQPIPDFVTRIGIVTSKTGAVIHDMLRVIRRKNPWVNVLIYPVKVQGDGAAEEIAAAVTELNRPEYALDVIIVARGGGSFEDLFCFSEEAPVRAIFNATVPVVTGIGHEPDYALCDAVADYSASTPTAAAEAVVPDAGQLLGEWQWRLEALCNAMRGLLEDHERTLDLHATEFITRTQDLLSLNGQKTQQRAERLADQWRHYRQLQQKHLQQAAAQLDAYSPLAILGRGYAVAMDATGRPVQSITSVQTGDAVSIRLQDGQLFTRIESKESLP
ncbi:MAG: exodeoxyribonuclease VII large subunit [Candidatus Melainabacteria bacterium]